MCTRPATDSTATGSGGATIAPKAMAAGIPMPGIMSHAAPATTAVDTTTRQQPSAAMSASGHGKQPQELFCAVAKSKGGRKMGRISSGEISNSGKPGMKVRQRPEAASGQVGKPEPIPQAHCHHRCKQQPDNERQLIHFPASPAVVRHFPRPSRKSSLPTYPGGTGSAESVSVRASTTSSVPSLNAMVRRMVPGSSRTAAATKATLALEVSVPLPGGLAGSVSIRPVAGSSVKVPGPRTVQSRAVLRR